jgi:TatD DNase family protein
MTFKTADTLRDTLRAVPLDRLLVETDSPYLAPVPFRGKRNEPAYVAHTAVKLAEIKGLSFGEMEQASTRNFLRLFAKVTPPCG